MPSPKRLINLKKLSASAALLKCQNQPEDTRPHLYFLAGPNGAGKSTVFKLLLENGAPLPFVNADVLARTLNGIPDPDVLAQRLAEVMRAHLAECRTSFATETVFSDPNGSKLDYLRKAKEQGFHVVLIAVWIPSPAASAARVRARVENGGHTVPADKLARRYSASMKNLKAALGFVETAIVLDNSGALEEGPQVAATTKNGQVTWQAKSLPRGIAELLPQPNSTPK